ncbi:MAG: hypothetical protein FD135_4162 [Comamonadaceae bacterium]|nr:MAG: hypothetical protein FD135_4162 [Comamonadaceae bacterium]
MSEAPVSPTPSQRQIQAVTAPGLLPQAGLAAAGHFDELTASLSNSGAPYADLTSSWGHFFEKIEADTAADLDLRATNLARQVRDNGITYNVYADENGPQRPWSLDLFPLLIEAKCWHHIEAGVLQRVRLLEHVLADVYGPQTLLTEGYLPPALVHGHPGYLRAMHGVEPVGGRYLHIAAFDLARGPDGNWWLESQRTQARANAPRPLQAWAICWKTVWPSRRNSARLLTACGYNGWPAPTVP